MKNLMIILALLIGGNAVAQNSNGVNNKVQAEKATIAQPTMKVKANKPAFQAIEKDKVNQGNAKAINAKAEVNNVNAELNKANAEIKKENAQLNNEALKGREKEKINKGNIDVNAKNAALKVKEVKEVKEAKVKGEDDHDYEHQKDEMHDEDEENLEHPDYEKENKGK
ncbi:MAG: hypothetical protein ACI9O4_000328 [Chitinophagales bacterium]|jgi:hypothetical protein